MKKAFKDIFEITQIKLSESIEDGKYKCVLICAGETATANMTINVDGVPVACKKYYMPEAIESAVSKGLFEGCPALFRSTEQHLAVEDTGINYHVGHFTNVVWNAAEQCAEGIFNTSKHSEYARSFREKLAAVWQKTKDVGLSIAAEIKGYLTKNGEQHLIVVSEIDSLQSVDVVSKGNAGGQLVALLAESIKKKNKFFQTFKNGESYNMNPELKAQIFALLMTAALIGEGVTVETASDEDLVNGLFEYTITLLNTVDTSLSESQMKDKANKIAEAMKELRKGMTDTDKEKVSASIGEAYKLLKDAGMIKSKTAEGKPKATSQVPAGISEEMNRVLNEAKLLISESYMRGKSEKSNLPEPIKDKINKMYGGQILSQEQIDTIFTAEQDAYAKLNPNHVDNGGADVKLKTDAIDKFQLAMDYLMLNPATFRAMSAEEQAKYKDVKGIYSFKDMYVDYTGDKAVTGKIFKGSLAEAGIESTSFTNVLGNSLHRALLAEYNASAYSQTWKRIATVVPRTDFKENTVIRVGGFGDLPTVAESGDYTEEALPTEAAVKYALSKKGHTLTISMESIRNDDLGFIRRIPQKWGVAAARTLHKAVFNGILTNQAMDYDTKALFHADHYNLLTAELDSTSYVQAIIKLMQQKELDNAEPIGLTPKFLLVGISLIEMAYKLTTPAFGLQNNVADFAQNLRIEPVVIPNNTTKSWQLVCDPAEAPLYEIGFLDGKEEPELFVQDLPTQGYTFSNDGIKYKIRHVYNGDLIDHRAIVGSIPVEA